MTEFWLTVQTGISDPELVFDSHASPPLINELVPTYENSMDSIPTEKVEDATGFAKTFPDKTMCVPNACRPIFAARHS